MARPAPGPWASVVIITLAVIVTYVDHRRQKRAERLNQEGRCGKCGTVQLGPGHRVPISGGPRFVRTGWVCEGCYETVRLHDRVIWLVIASALLILLVLAWREGHP